MIFNVPILTLIGLVVLFLFIAGIIFILDFAYLFPIKEKNKNVINLMVVLLAGFIIFGSCFWWYNGTEAGKRSAKTWESNINSGITRHVQVYDMDGDLIQEYTGKFDIEFSDSERILFDDENGNRHIIYFKTGMVIVDEIDNK